MNLTATITSVNEISGNFSDGSQWSIGCKPENSTKRIEDMRSLVGVEGQYEVNERADYGGKKQWSLTNYPGKPQQGGGSGFIASGGTRGTFQTRYRDTEQGTKEERESIHRSVALQQAIVFSNTQHPGEPPHILSIADAFYDWLTATAKPVTQPQETPNNSQSSGVPGAASKPTQTSMLPDEPPKPAYAEKVCPACGKKEHVLKSKLDGTPPWYCFKKIGGCGHQWGDVEALTQMGLKTGAQIEREQSTVVKASKAIDECVRTKNAPAIKTIMEGIVTRHEEGKLEAHEVDELEKELDAAVLKLKNESSAKVLGDWWDKGVAPGQKRGRGLAQAMEELNDRF